MTFFEQLLGIRASKLRDDYAKFELDSPPLVFSLEPRSPAEHGSLNHAGFRFTDATALVEAQRRLEAAGVATQREEGVECCYARQTKFWVHDFDQRLWEFYVLEGDIDHRGNGQTLDEVADADTAAVAAASREPVLWEHRMGSPLEFPEEPCEEIRLRGTFNVPTTDAALTATLRQAYQSLQPGGRIGLHMLTCEQAIDGDLNLSGPAAHVKQVPVRADLMRALEEAGFVDVALTTFRSGACFESQGRPLRETRMQALRPLTADGEDCTVVFKGPFRQITDDSGRTWDRGRPTAIPRSRWQMLAASSVADMFTLLPETAAASRCGT